MRTRYRRAMADEGVGPLLREWRGRRRLSQLQLSSATGVSTRHLSCVETGRSTPSRELVLHLARALEVPARSANDLLLAAGYAPSFSQHPLDADAMAPVAATLRLLLEGNDPNPTTVIDTRWDLVDANAAALWLCTGVADHLLEPPINIARLSLHPEGLSARITNTAEFSRHLIHQMERTLSLTHDPQLRATIDELRPFIPSSGDPPEPTVVLPMRLQVEGHHLSFLSTITTFGAARDITVQELSIETFYPADQHTADIMRSRPWR
ncbi:MAG TPA: helix-turn-helix transcriptional regulator [Acidimicrobiales bacterium]|nr:helix-turn-helix transcriptional regulator [Acidimicrobiales bacterium]